MYVNVTTYLCKLAASGVETPTHLSMHVCRSKWCWLNGLLGRRGGVLQLVKGNLESQELLLLGRTLSVYLGEDYVSSRPGPYT